MKRILAVGLASLFAFPVLSTVSVVAHAETSSNSASKPEDTVKTVQTTANNVENEVNDDAKTIADRVAQRKAELKTKLSTAEKTRIQTKCKAAQGTISSVKGRVKGIETSRGEVYTNLLTRLNDLSEKLKAKGVDTTTLNADIATLKTKITTFNTDLTAYKQSVSDLASMDCATDPDGFKASLEAARTALKKVNDDAAAVRTYLNDTVKPLLKTIRSELEKSESTTTDSSTAPSNTNTGTTNTPTTSGGN